MNHSLQQIYQKKLYKRAKFIQLKKKTMQTDKDKQINKHTNQIFKTSQKPQQQMEWQEDSSNTLQQNLFQKQQQKNNQSHHHEQSIKLQNNLVSQDCQKKIPLQQQNQQKECQKIQQQNQDYGGGDYEDYGQQGYYDNYMQQDSMNRYDKRISSEINTQYQMEDLVKIIQKQVEKINQLTGFSRQWALIYFQTCGWKMDLVYKFIDSQKSHQKMIFYIPNSESHITSVSDMCDICCHQNQVLYKNFCGDQCCQECWKGHLNEKMTTYNKDPFPSCINGNCPVRVSASLSQQIAKNDSKFKKLYYRTLCRGYAYGNPSVKMCKGKQKFSCDRCFKINKIFQILECGCCGNFVCGRCGQQYHMPSECYERPNFKKIIEQSTNFIQTLNYRICPYCSQAVQRSSGCNSLVCKCKQTFCYICGQKWLPNHNQHGVCYRQKQIKALQQQKKKKKENQKQYLDKLQKNKAQMETITSQFKKIQDVQIQKIKDILISDFKIIANQLDYLKPLTKKLKISLIILKNYVLTLYFRDDQLLMAEYLNLKNSVDKMYTFVSQILPALIQAFGNQNKEKKNVGKDATKMRKENANVLQQLAKQKIQMLQHMKNLQKYMLS